MTQVITLAAEMRDRAGKGAAHAIRRMGRIPAVVYGDGKPPMMISMDLNLVMRHAPKAGFFTSLFDIEVDGKKHRVLPRDVQFDPVTDRPVHIDFLRVAPKTRVRVHVPVRFINADKSPGIKRGGTLNIVHHEIEVSCPPERIPAKFEIDLEGLQIGDAVHISAIKFPDGVKPTTVEKDYTIASIAVPSAIRAEAAEAAAQAAVTATAAEAAVAAPAAAAGAKEGEKTAEAGAKSAAGKK